MALNKKDRKKLTDTLNDLKTKTLKQFNDFKPQGEE